MKIVEINGTNYAGTGNIVLNIAEKARLEGFEVFTCCKNSKKGKTYHYDNQVFIGYRYERIISEQLAMFTGCSDSFNFFGTKAFIKKLKEIKPDLIHLHVLHDTYVNHKLLFDYINKIDIPVVYTFHDCWPFTGKCPHFELANCYKWKNNCNKCPQLNRYPKILFDRTRCLFTRKKQMISNIKNLSIVAPSKWLHNYINQSFYKNINSQVIYNGIDLCKYHYVQSNILDNYKIENKKIVLGVANTWHINKGLDIFIELSKLLSSDYRIVLVGTDNSIDKQLPNNIVSIHRTHNINEMIELYSAADVFVNPTREEVFGLVNVEALSCGIPVVCFNTGGCAEIINDKCGVLVERNDIESMKEEIENICENHPFNKQACINRAKEFDVNKMASEYIALYKKLLNIK